MGKTGPLPTDKFKAIMEKAGTIYECSWAVGTVMDDSTGRARPVVVFHDEDGGRFAHAFSFGSIDMLRDFCDRLFAAGLMAAQRNPGGIIR